MATTVSGRRCRRVVATAVAAADRAVAGREAVAAGVPVVAVAVIAPARVAASSVPVVVVRVLAVAVHRAVAIADSVAG